MPRLSLRDVAGDNKSSFGILCLIRSRLDLQSRIPLMAAGAVVFACRPALLPVSVNVSGIDMWASRSAISPAEPVLVPPELERQLEGGGFV